MNKYTLKYTAKQIEDILNNQTLENEKIETIERVIKHRDMLIVGAVENGHTLEDCDYLCYGGAGIEDDSIVIADALAASKKGVFLLPGDYVLKTTLSIPNGKTLEGSITNRTTGANSTRIYRDFNYEMFVLNKRETILVGNGGIIKNIYINGGAINDPPITSYREIRANARAVVDNCVVRYSSGTGIAFGSWAIITNCDTRDCEYGISSISTNSTPYISNNFIINARAGIDASLSSYATIANNSFSNTVDSLIQDAIAIITDGDSNVISDNKIRGYWEYGIMTAPNASVPYQNIIKGNIIELYPAGPISTPIDIYNDSGNSIITDNIYKHQIVEVANTNPDLIINNLQIGGGA